MDARHLRTFLAVVERRSFRRAAERLYLSQPTVSAHVQALEREVGAPLLERGRAPGVTLTAAGERLLPHARALVALEDEALAAVRAWRLRFDERLRIASSIFVAASVLPGALRRLRDAHPRVQLALRTGFSPQVAEAVAAGEADLGLSRQEPEGHAALARRRLSSEPVVAVAPAAWGQLDLQEALRRHPLLTHNHPGYWDRLLSRLRALGVDFQPMEVRQVDVTCRLIAAGLGLSFLPLSALEGGPELRVLPAAGMDLELPRAGTWALWRPAAPPSAAGRALLDLLAAQGGGGDP